VLGLIFFAGAICVIGLFAVTEQLWPSVIAAVCWLAVVLWFLWPRRDDEVREVRTTSSDTFDVH
jgi:hypothetical protein